jgi:hypothetical protein
MSSVRQVGLEPTTTEVRKSGGLSQDLASNFEVRKMATRYTASVRRKRRAHPYQTIFVQTFVRQVGLEPTTTEV